MNLLTGDYEAVLQVSEATINRLMASMHQNDRKDPKTPTFPHSAVVRLGKYGVVDGVQGEARAQVGVPRIHLVPGSTDAFDIEVGLRISYVPDPGSTPLPGYMHGILRARYQATDIDPDCVGWGRVASEYLWFRVVESSVSFAGEYDDDDQPLNLAPIDVPATNAAVSKQLAHLLVNVFEPAPHKINENFRPPLFKSIVEQDGDLKDGEPPLPKPPVGGSAVLVPVGVFEARPAGGLGSLDHVLLNGNDFAIAVSQKVVEQAMAPAISAIKSFTSTTKHVTTVNLGVGSGSVTYTYHHAVDAGSVIVTWTPNDTYARIEINASGHTQGDGPSFDWDVTQPLQLAFDAGSEALALRADSATIKIRTTSGVPLPSFVWDEVRPTVRDQVQSAVDAAAGSAQSTLTEFSSGAGLLAAQLQKMDRQANAWLEQASFYHSGIVFRGRVSVAARRRATVSFTRVGKEAFTAFESWIPGGRIDSFRWTWRWNDSLKLADRGEARVDDRFVLRRPPGDTTRFGKLRGEPLPGLDGNGTVCLFLVGKVVNRVTGRFDNVETTVSCRHFGLLGPFRKGAGRIYVPEYEAAAPPGPHPPEPVEIGMVDISAGPEDGAGTANTLVVSVGDSFSGEHAHTIIDGLARCTREDAGLLVALVFSEGALNGDGERIRRLRAFSDRLDAPLIVNEDVDGTWSNALSLQRGQLAWCLVSPGGGTLWRKEGALGAEELASVLDGCLYPSPPATPSAVQVEREWSPEAASWLLGAVHASHSHDGRRPCPASVTVGPGDIETVVSGVAFVHKSASSSSEEIDRLRAANEGRGERDPAVLVIVDGADESEARRLGDALGPAFIVVPDPEGSLAARAGVRYWPTTVSVDDKEGAWQ